MIHESQCLLLRSLKSWLLLLLSGNLTVCHGQSRKVFWGKSSTSELFSMANCKSLEGKFRKISHDYYPIHSYPYQILNHIKPYHTTISTVENFHVLLKSPLLVEKHHAGAPPRRCHAAGCRGLPQPLMTLLWSWDLKSLCGSSPKSVQQGDFTKNFSGFHHSPKNFWLVVWNHGFFWLSIQLGISSSQLTNSLHHFSEGWRKTTNQPLKHHRHPIHPQ